MNPILTLGAASEDQLLSTMQPATVTDLNDPALDNSFSALTGALHNKIPAIREDKHPRPAYLAANQIGLDTRTAMLYLPGRDGAPAEMLYIKNPIVTPPELTGHKRQRSEETFGISTFFYEDVRFSDSLYASRVTLTYHNESNEKRSLILDGDEAKAAQMMVDFLNGITPFDRVEQAKAGDRTKDGVEALINNPNKAPGRRTLVTTNYHAKGGTDREGRAMPEPEYGKIRDDLRSFQALRREHPCTALAEQRGR